MKWKREESRFAFGQHAWLTSGKQLVKCGFLPAFLPADSRWRGCWIDKCQNMHWRWFKFRSDAKKWIEIMASGPDALESEDKTR